MRGRVKKNQQIKTEAKPIQIEKTKNQKSITTENKSKTGGGDSREKERNQEGRREIKTTKEIERESKAKTVSK